MSSEQNQSVMTLADDVTISNEVTKNNDVTTSNDVTAIVTNVSNYEALVPPKMSPPPTPVGALCKTFSSIRRGDFAMTSQASYANIPTSPNICIVQTYQIPRISNPDYQNTFVSITGQKTSVSDDVTHVYSHNVICNPIERGNSSCSQRFSAVSDTYEEVYFIPRKGNPQKDQEMESTEK